LVGALVGACFGGVFCFFLLWLSFSNVGAAAGVQDMEVTGMFTMCGGGGLVLGALCGFCITLLATRVIPIDDTGK
jgi:hypothetical protein